MFNGHGLESWICISSRWRPHKKCWPLAHPSHRLSSGSFILSQPKETSRISARQIQKCKRLCPTSASVRRCGLDRWFSWSLNTMAIWHLTHPPTPGIPYTNNNFVKALFQNIVFAKIPRSPKKNILKKRANSIPTRYPTSKLDVFNCNKVVPHPPLPCSLCLAPLWLAGDGIHFLSNGFWKP